MNLPQDVEQKILEVIGMPNLNRRNLSFYTKRLNKIRKQMYRLSDYFAKSEAAEEKYADAYFAYNFPMNLMKVMAIVKELRYIYPKTFRNKNKLRILDIGCGDGAGMFGLYLGFESSAAISLTGYDVSRQMLMRCKELTKWLKNRHSNVSVKLLRRKISRGIFKKTTQKYNIILFANSLVEIFEEDEIRLQFIEQVLKCTTNDGILIVIEPALKKFSRRLMNLRQGIIEKQRSYVLLPCLHKNVCPLLEIRKQKEWCHQSVSWEPPDFMKILNQGLNREINYLKFSYLVVSKKDYAKHFCNGFLAISHLLREKGRKRCFLCTSNGRVELVRLDKSKSKLNMEFDNISKGDVIALKNIIQKKPHYWQIAENTHICILHHKGNQ